MSTLNCPECGVELEAHPTGKCLDQWAWQLLCGGEECSGPTELICPDDDGGFIPACRICAYVGWDKPHKVSVPRYGQDIGAAWPLTDKLVNPEIIRTGGEWLVRFNVKNQPPYEGWAIKSARGETAQLAITRAAIEAAKGGTEG